MVSTKVVVLMGQDFWVIGRPYVYRNYHPNYCKSGQGKNGYAQSGFRTKPAGKWVRHQPACV